MVRPGTIVLVLLFAVGCSSGDGSEPPSETSPSQEPRELRVVPIFAGAPGQGPSTARAVIATSAAALSRETGTRIPDSGEGTYLAAYWGEKPTGGYSLEVRAARLEGDGVTVRLALREPPPDAIVTQALTYPYAVAVVRGVDPEAKDFSFVDGRGRRLDWPLRRGGK